MTETIREATPEDARGIAIVHVKMWQQTYRGQVPDSFLDNMSIEKRFEVWKSGLQNPTPNNYMFVVDVDGIVAGWVTGGVNRDDDLPKTVGELQGIYMHPDYAGKEYGSKLMQRILNVLRNDGYKQATLWVLDTNKKTRDWYESKGWKVEGKTKVEHRDGFDLNEVRYIIDL